MPTVAIHPHFSEGSVPRTPPLPVPHAMPRTKAKATTLQPSDARDLVSDAESWSIGLDAWEAFR